MNLKMPENFRFGVVIFSNLQDNLQSILYSAALILKTENPLWLSQ